MSKKVDGAPRFRQNDIIEYRHEADGLTCYALIYSVDLGQGKFWLDKGIYGGKKMVSASDLTQWDAKVVSVVNLIDREVKLKSEILSLRNMINTARRELEMTQSCV